MKYVSTNVEMEVDSFEVAECNDMWDGTCNLMVKLINSQTIMIASMPGFTYINNKYEDEDVIKFIETQLSKNK